MKNFILCLVDNLKKAQQHAEQGTNNDLYVEILFYDNNLFYTQMISMSCGNKILNFQYTMSDTGLFLL